MSGEDTKEKIGEIVSASVLGGMEAKLELENPEELRIGYPVIVEGEKYNFYCIVHDILNPRMDIAERLAGSRFRETVLPSPEIHEGYTGKVFYSKAQLRAIQLIQKDEGALSTPETIPPYFSPVRMATREDVDTIYEVCETSAPFGTLRGLDDFWVNVDLGKLAEKPFGIFGRTGVGKSILNKIVCLGIVGRGVGSVLVFDMHGEYGVHSETDSTEGIKYYFPEKVEVFSLDPERREKKPFMIDPGSIAPSDIIVAFQDLTDGMIDALFAVNARRGAEDLITAIENADPEDYSERVLHPMSLSGLQRKISRLRRFGFVKGGAGDGFKHIKEMIRSGRSIVLDFGKYGRDTMAYLFIANVISRRLFDLYTEDEGKDFPRLVVFLEEAHKFLDPGIASYTIFSKLARETRKFNLILALVDQRPSRIDDEVRSQLANRLVLSLKEPSDISSALSGVSDRAMWEKLIGTIPPRIVGVFGDAISIPTVIQVMDYNPKNVKEKLVGETGRMDTGDMDRIARDVEEIFD